MAKFKVNGQTYTTDDFCFADDAPLSSIIEYWMMHEIGDEYGLSDEDYRSLVEMMTAFADNLYSRSIVFAVDGCRYEIEKI